MTAAPKRRRALQAGLAALLIVGVACSPAAANGVKQKERPWPGPDDAPQTATGCEYMGKGYMKLPGSDTCVRISGFVRSEGAIISH